jgi:hypothetical protein
MANQKRKRMKKSEAEIVMKHGVCIYKGTCRDCAAGMIGGISEGFEYFDQDGDGRGFWFCRYCGSNHVTVTLKDGETIEQGDLY